MKNKILAVVAVVVVLAMIFAGPKKKREPVQEVMESVPVFISLDLQETGFNLSELTALAVSSDDKYLASGTGEGSLMIWDINVSRRIHSFRVGNYAVTAAGFSPNLSALAVGSSSGEITVWNFDENTVRPSFRIVTTSGISSIMFNKTGNEIISLSTEGELCRWNSSTGALISKEASGSDTFNAAALGPDGNHVLYGSADTLEYAQLPNWARRGEYTGINGEILAAAAGDGKFAASGKGYIYIWNDNLQPVNIPVTENISALAINSNATRLLTGSEDGVIRMWNMETREEIIRYISFGNADEVGEWIAMLPSGYYNSSALGATLMKVETGEETFTIAQFSNALFRPDILSKSLKEGGSLKLERSIENIAVQLPPIVEIIGPRTFSVTGDSIDVRVKITVRAGGLGNLKVTRIPIGQDTRPRLIGYKPYMDSILNRYTENGMTVYEAVVSAPLVPGENVIGIAAYGESLDWESESARVNINTSWAGPDADKPVLYVLTMSIGEYQNTSKVSTLDYTRNDANKFAELLLTQRNGGLYKDVVVVSREDGDITKKGFIDTFSELAKRVGRNDNFVFFYAGHGDVKDGDFYFVPHDSIGADNPHENNITMNDIVSAITEIHAKHSLILLDTCNSGTLLEGKETAFGRLIDQLNEKAIITATLGNQKALETDVEGHGLFTASLLASYRLMDKPEDQNEYSQYVTVADIIEFTNQDVPVRIQNIGMDVTAASRGFNKTDYIEIQSPLASEPGVHFTNFPVFDRYTESGNLVINSVTAGSVNLYRMYSDDDPQEFNINAGASVTWPLLAGSYRASIIYGNKEVEEIDVEVRGFPDPSLTRYVPENTVISFTYKEPLPGEVRIRNNTAGLLRITGRADMNLAAGSNLTLNFTPGQYTISLEYNDGYIERRTITATNDSQLQVDFAYRITVPEGFVFIPPGSFLMGSPSSEAERQSNEQQHNVTISSGFYMSAYQITQRDYQEIMGSNPSNFKGNNLPVENVEWLDAIRYCNARSIKEGLRPVYNISGRNVTLISGANGYRLPTEAEWEYACRAGTTGAYPTGNSITVTQANFRNNYNSRTRDAGSFQPNRWGLYDMAGNVWEWCWDWYAPYTGDAQTDPMGAASGEQRIVRGGGYTSTLIGNLRSAYRGFNRPATKANDVGFRVVRVREIPAQ